MKQREREAANITPKRCQKTNNGLKKLSSHRKKKAQYIKGKEFKETDRYRILARRSNVGNLSHGIRRKCNMVLH